MNINILVHAGSDDAFIVWTSDFIPDCRGFAHGPRPTTLADGVNSTSGSASAETIWLSVADAQPFSPPLKP